MKELNLFGDCLEEIKPIESLNKKYSHKVLTPVYHPNRGGKVSIYECYDSSKYSRLIRRIDHSDVTKEEKDFLKLAASRFIVFQYQDIAEYYANASKDMQQLMEALALVIIDFDKAIENGFVQLNDKMRRLYEEEL